jgi:murein DD-endopeptidase MepM/ murein hydrolase activator NlpD
VGAAEKASAVSAARKAADAAAGRYAAAQSALAAAERDTARLEAQAQVTETQLGGLIGRVRELAVRQYVGSGSEIAWLQAEDMSRAARTQVMVRFIRLGATDEVDRYQALTEDLGVQREALKRAADARRTATQKLKTEQTAALRELSRLQEIERRQEAARQAAARQAAAAKRATSSRPPRAAATRGAAGTPTAGTPAAGAPGAARVIGSGAWRCPVQGAVSFTNDWGQPRSGGRRHQGTDMLAARGTPVVANVAGTVSHHNSRLGGLSYYLKGDDGNTYFGTHLASYAASGRVAAGTVVGTVGNSGNASGGPPHLHFEIHPGGGGPTNPYPTLRQYC